MSVCQCRTSSVFFLSEKKRREKILSVSIEQVLYFFLSVRNGGRKFYRIIELVLYFFYWLEKILCVIWREYNFTNFINFLNF